MRKPLLIGISLLATASCDLSGTPAQLDLSLKNQARAAAQQFQGELGFCVPEIRKGYECSTSQPEFAHEFMKSLSSLKDPQPNEETDLTFANSELSPDRDFVTQESHYFIESFANPTTSAEGNSLKCDYKWKVTFSCSATRDMPDGCQDAIFASVNPALSQTICPPFSTPTCILANISEPESDCSPAYYVNY